MGKFDDMDDAAEDSTAQDFSSPVRQAFKDLDVEVEKAFTQLDRLHARISPVLGVHSHGIAETTKEKQENCEVALLINAHVDRLRTLNDQLSDMTARVEL